MKASKFSDTQKACIIKQGEDGTPVAKTITKNLQSEPYHDMVVSKLVESRIDDFDASQHLPLSNKQKTALRTVLSNRVMVLAGYAGSGKTTSLYTQSRTVAPEQS